jgi:hypothetical protein
VTFFKTPTNIKIIAFPLSPRPQVVSPNAKCKSQIANHLPSHITKSKSTEVPIYIDKMLAKRATKIPNHPALTSLAPETETCEGLLEGLYPDFEADVAMLCVRMA